jgi:hypothetical protein
MQKTTQERKRNRGGTRTSKVPAPVAVVNDDLKPLLTPLRDLNTDPKNARKHDDPGIAAIARSLQRFGQQKPIVAREDGTVIAGNGTIQAALNLGWTHVAAVRFSDDEAVARAYAIADNRTAELSEWDFAKLAQEMADANEAGFDSDWFGFSEKEMREVEAKAGLDFNDPSGRGDPKSAGLTSDHIVTISLSSKALMSIQEQLKEWSLDPEIVVSIA